MTTLRANVDSGKVTVAMIFHPATELPPWPSLTEPFHGLLAITPLGDCWVYKDAWELVDVGGGLHPDLAAHDVLGLASQAELDAHAHGGLYSVLGHTHQGGSGMNMLKKTGNQIINAGAGVFTDITDLTFPVVSGLDYAFHYYVTFQSAATTTGWKAGVNCPAGPLDFWMQSDVIANGAAGVATHTERHNTVRDDMTQLTSTIAAAVDLAVRIEGRYRCTANGVFAPRFANELASNTQLVVQQGSWGWWF